MSSENQKVLIYGGKGWIGGMFVEKWKSLFPNDTIIISSTRVDPNNAQSLIDEIISADRVICMIGRTSGVTPEGKVINNIDYCETNLISNLNDNLVAPILLAELCKQAGKHLLYLGTGCIFSWDTSTNQDRLVTETDVPDFFGSAYSIVKGKTDSLMKCFDNVCNVRIRMPIANYDCTRNFISKIIRYEKIHNMPNSMTYLPDFLPIIVMLSKTGYTGTINATNPGFIDHNTILTEYKKQVDPSHVFTVISDPVTLGLKSQRSNNILNTDKIQAFAAKHNFELKTIQDSILDCFKTFNRSF